MVSAMNWQLLLILVSIYTGLVFLLALATKPGARYLRNRFQQQFSEALSEDAIKKLSPKQRERWDRIYFDEYGRTPYRWFEILFSLFHYPAIIVLGVLLNRPTLNFVPMFFISGTVYVALFYVILR